MGIKASTLSIGLTGHADEVVAPSQRWLLSGMRKYGAALVKMLWRILNNEDDVCDAYQDTFLQLAHWQGGQKPENVRAFLFRTASNVAISMLRKRKVHLRVCKDLSESLAESHVVDYARDLDSQQLQRTLREYIAQLPEGMREVVLLKDLADLPYRQVAKTLGITVASARVYRCRAIRRLAVLMTQKEDDR